MRVGFETILWGRRIDDLDYALDVIAACGYQGVEFAQHHEEIFVRSEDDDSLRPVKDIGELLTRLHARNLSLIGLAAGTLKERADFLADYRDAYLYTDRWEREDVELALARGFVVAIHPHWLMPLSRVRQAEKIFEDLKDHPHIDRLRLIVDTAHTVLAEDDPAKTVRIHRERLASVHLKSWRPDYGRWSHRYAHGFCPPGAGIVDVRKVLDDLIKKPFLGWIVMEQDYFDVTRERAALECARWMEDEGPKWGIEIRTDPERIAVLERRRRVHPFFAATAKRDVDTLLLELVNGARSPVDVFQPPLTGAALSGPLSELLLGRLLSRRVAHHPDPREFYGLIAKTVRQLLDSSIIKVWSYNPVIYGQRAFCLVGIDAPGFNVTTCRSVINEQDSLAGRILSHPTVYQFDMTDQTLGQHFVDREWLDQLRARAPWLLVVPIFNTSNPHQLRYLITSASAKPLLPPVGKDRFDLEASRERLGQIEAVSWVVSHFSDYLTDEICSAATGYTNHLCGKSGGKIEEFMDSLATFLRETFHCNAVTVFLEDVTRTRLEPVGKSKEMVEWCDERHYYSDEDRDTRTWLAWKGREMVFDGSAQTGRAREKRPTDDDRDEILFAPLARRGGDCHGVIRLHNKSKPGAPLSSMFTDDDAAKLDAIIQTALPHLELLKLQKQQTESLARMVHEFQAPLVAIRGAIDLMKSDLKRKGQPPEEFFRRDYPDDVLQWAELMGRLTRNAEALTGAQRRPLRRERTLMLADVVMPMLRQIKLLVPAAAKLETRAEELETIPPLYVDKTQMQQVFFNLLSNAIKYGGSKERVIRVVITGGPVGTGYSIFFQDWGSGIDERDREEIFHPGVRGRKAVLSDVAGQGLGLYVVRSIVGAHRGSIRVRSCRNPTTFEIALPKSLVFRPRSPDSTA